MHSSVSAGKGLYFTFYPPLVYWRISQIQRTIETGDPELVLARLKRRYKVKACPPPLQNIPTNLQADFPGAGAATEASTINSQALQDYAEVLTIGEELMFTMDVPYIPALEAPISLVQAAATSVVPPVDFILKECTETQPTPDYPRSAMRVVDPAHMLKNYYASVGREIELADIKTTLLQGTKHGKLTAEVDNTGLTSYRYDPIPSFLGEDQAIFIAEYGDKRFKIILDIKVLEVIDERNPICPDAKLMKVKKIPSK